MPGFFFRRTGIVYNVTKSAVGVIINKKVGNRYIEKRVNIRIEHIRHSTCRDDFLARVKANAAKAREAKAKGGKLQKTSFYLNFCFLGENCFIFPFFHPFVEGK